MQTEQFFQVLVTLPANETHRQALEAACPGGSFAYLPQEALTEAAVAGADVIVGNLPHALLPACRRLKLLQLGSAGADGSSAAADTSSAPVFSSAIDSPEPESGTASCVGLAS